MARIAPVNHIFSGTGPGRPLGLDLHSFPHSQDAVDYYPFPRFQALFYSDQVVADRARLDDPAFGQLVRINNVYITSACLRETFEVKP